MNWIDFLALSSLGVLFYTYVGYGIIIKFLAGFKTNPNDQLDPNSAPPEVTHVIAAYNEADVIREKIENTLNLDYPENKIRTIIVTDGSNDGTVAICKAFDGFIEVFHQDARNGKLAAVNRVMQHVTSPITVFSDANTELNKSAIQKLVRHFQISKVGAVAGEKVILSESSDDAVSAGEGLYWKYESYLKKLDYRLHTVVGAAGELFAIRTELYETPTKDTLIEDFMITLNVAGKGYRVAYEPGARASEKSSIDINEELKRKVRISAGGLQASWRLRALYNPFKHGFVSFQLLSHRILRWTLAPLSLLILIVSSLILALQGSGFYQSLLALQIVCYLLAFLGWHYEKKKIRFKALFVPFYFAVMNLSVYLGLFNYLSGNYDVKWDKAVRK
jgi:cellulose synthase/poly-beta-1,6-N-acetylglucosamine synthase-like glycosyltransferase